MTDFVENPGLLEHKRSYSLGAESDLGNIEYKRHLLTDNTMRIDELTTQLSFRLIEGSGRAEYRIGVEDDGQLSRLCIDDLERSIIMLEMMVESISAKVASVERIEYRIEGDDKAESYHYGVVTIEACYEDETSKVDVRIAVCGNVDAGKSTCIGVLKTGILDDGRGSARTTTMVHSHEVESGRTSTVSQHVVGYNSSGKITNHELGSRQPSVDQITRQSVRLVTLVDLAGHEKYLRSMIYGVSSSLLDYALVMINARSGVTHMTHHHLTVAAMMAIPCLIIFSKVDGCPAHRYLKTLEETRELLRAPDIRKRLHVIQTEGAKQSNAKAETVAAAAIAAATAETTEPETERASETKNEEEKSKSAMAAALALKTTLTLLSASKQTTIPCIPISFTEGTNLEFLKRVCRFLPKRRQHAAKACSSLEFIVDKLFNVPGVGAVLHGFVNQGSLSTKASLWFGPMADHSFIRVTVRSIHFNSLPVTIVRAGAFATLSVKLDKNQIKQVRRGQVLMESCPNATSRFQAKINILYSQASTLRVGYTPYLHILMVRQSAIVEKIEILSSQNANNSNQGGISSSDIATQSASARVRDGDVVLRPGDIALLTFRFAHRREYIRPPMKIMFRDGKVKGVGQVTAVLDDGDVTL